MTRPSRLALALCVLPLLAGCIGVDVPEGAFFYPETRLRAESIVLDDSPAWSGRSESLSVPFAGGTVGVTRLHSRVERAPLILYCGGNMFRRRSHMAYAAGKLSPFGDALLFDYPGYGDTPGSADFTSFRVAGEAVADYARARADAEGRRLIAWGHSLGGPVCAEAAAHSRADALVLETTTPSARAAVDQMVGIWRPFVKIGMTPAMTAIDIPGALDGYTGKVVVLEAGRDDTLAPALSRRLARELDARSVRVDRLVFPQAGHLDIAEQPDFHTRLSAALVP